MHKKEILNKEGDCKYSLKTFMIYSTIFLVLYLKKRTHTVLMRIFEPFFPDTDLSAKV